MKHTFLVNDSKEIEALTQADAMDEYRGLTGNEPRTCKLVEGWGTPGFEEKLRALNQGA